MAATLRTFSGSLHTIAVFGQRFHQAIHDNVIVTFKLAAQGVGQKFFGDVAGDIFGARGNHGL